MRKAWYFWLTIGLLFGIVGATYVSTISHYLNAAKRTHLWIGVSSFENRESLIPLLLHSNQAHFVQSDIGDAQVAFSLDGFALYSGKLFYGDIVVNLVDDKIAYLSIKPDTMTTFIAEFMGTFPIESGRNLYRSGNLVAYLDTSLDKGSMMVGDLRLIDGNIEKGEWRLSCGFNKSMISKLSSN